MILNRCLYVGRLTHEKNLNILIESFSKVIEYFPSLHLDIVGDGPEFNNIHKQIESSNLQSNVHLHGFINNPAAFYSSSSIFILPSSREGFPNSILEAATNSLAIVTTINGGSMLLSNNINGILISTISPQSISHSIINLIRFPHYRLELSRRANSLSNKYSKELILKKWLVLC